MLSVCGVFLYTLISNFFIKYARYMSSEKGISNRHTQIQNKDTNINPRVLSDG